MPTIRENIQNNLAKYRKEAKLTQKELAEKIGVPATSLGTWEQGKSMPDIDTLYKISQILGVDLITISGFTLSDDDPNLNGFQQFHVHLDKLTHQAKHVGKELDTQLSDDENQLLADYRELNSQGKEYIRQTMHMARQTYKKMPDVPSLEHQA